jgi:hypothetical protein
MRNLYIHCGLAKTGTTSIQKFLSQSREQLNAIDYDYPTICQNNDGYNHGNLTWQFFNHTYFDPRAGTADDFLGFLNSSDRKSNIVISAEGFANCLVREHPSVHFLDFLRSAVQLNDAVYLVFSFRTFWRYIESLYLQLLKAGSLKVSLSHHIERRLIWLRRLLEEIAALREIVGDDRVLVADVDMSDSISALLPLLQIDESKLGPRPEKLNARLGIKKAALLYLFQFDPGGELSGRSQRQILRFAKSLDKMADLPDDEYSYHIVTLAEANRIQDDMRAHVPGFLRAELASACAAVDSSHQAAVLENVELPVKEALSIIEGLISAKLKRREKRSQTELSA